MHLMFEKESCLCLGPIRQKSFDVEEIKAAVDFTTLLHREEEGGLANLLSLRLKYCVQFLWNCRLFFPFSLSMKLESKGWILWKSDVIRCRKCCNYKKIQGKTHTCVMSHFGISVCFAFLSFDDTFVACIHTDLVEVYVIISLCASMPITLRKKKWCLGMRK